MKKVFLMLFVAAIAFCGCKDESYKSAEYAGTYNGKFTVVKTATETEEASTSEKSGKLVFAQNPANKENLLWEGLIDMQPTSENVYETNTNSFTADMLKAVTKLIKIDEYTDAAIEKIQAKAEFSGTSVTMKIYYKATIFGSEVDIVVATFTGTRNN